MCEWDIALWCSRWRYSSQWNLAKSVGNGQCNGEWFESKYNILVLYSHLCQEGGQMPRAIPSNYLTRCSCVKRIIISVHKFAFTLPPICQQRAWVELAKANLARMFQAFPSSVSLLLMYHVQRGQLCHSQVYFSHSILVMIVSIQDWVTIVERMAQVISPRVWYKKSKRWPRENKLTSRERIYGVTRWHVTIFPRNKSR